MSDIQKVNSHICQLLPQNRSFSDLLLPFLAPYLVYVGMSNLPERLVSPEAAQGIKLVATAAALLVFRNAYRFGRFKALHAGLALLWLPVALFAWVAPFYLLSAVGLTDAMVADSGAALTKAYFLLRLFNSVVLVAIFEELFTRVYMMGWLYQAGGQRQAKGLIESLVSTLDQRPLPLATVPVSFFAVVGSSTVFAAGHAPVEYLSSVLYFLFTAWLYRKTRSLWVCIILHGLTNLAVALFARYGGMGWLW